MSPLLKPGPTSKRESVGTTETSTDQRVKNLEQKIVTLEANAAMHQTDANKAKKALVEQSKELRRLVHAQANHSAEIDAAYREIALLTSFLLEAERGSAPMVTTVRVHQLDERASRVSGAEKPKRDGTLSRLFGITSGAAKISKRASRARTADIQLVASSGFFEEKWFVSRYSDAGASHLEPVAYFLSYGAQKKLNPGPNFDTAYYLESYPDVAASGQNPLLHYLKFGKLEKRAIKRVL